MSVFIILYIVTDTKHIAYLPAFFVIGFLKSATTDL